MGKLFIEEGNGLTIGHIANEKLQRLVRINNSEGIYIAKVLRKMPNYNGYIIALDENNNGLLDERHVIGNIKPGDEVLVGLYKSTDEDKLDKYTMNYSIAGRYMVYHPHFGKVSASKKMPREKRQELFDFAKENNMNNLVFRTCAYMVEFEKLLEEYKSLIRVNEKIIQESKFLPIPRVLFTSYKNLYSIVNEVGEDIVVNSKDIYKYLKNYLNHGNIILDENYHYKYDEEIGKDLSSIKSGVFELSNGGNIIVEKTKALNVIDVNGPSHESFLKTNKLAVLEGIRAMEVMELQGIIIMDCITMNEGDKISFDKYIKHVIKSHSKIKYHGITKLGLLEFTKSGIAIDI